MFRFFSSILKRKKVVLSLLLFFVFVGIAAPRQAHAIFPVLIPLIAAAGGVAVSAGATLTAGTVAFAIFTVLLIVGTLVASVVSSIFAFATGTALKLVLLMSINYTGYTKVAAVLLGWTIMRDFANIIIVLSLIVIALATIFNFKSYEAKKLLPWLIGVAILINFSLAICGVIIDVSNITMGYLLSGGQPRGTTVGNFLYNDVLSKSIDVAVETASTAAKALSVVGLPLAISQIFYNFATGVVALIYAMLFIARVAMLWILVMLSPLAFACAILPATRGYFTKWLNLLLQWCFIGILGAMFLYLGNRIYAETPSIWNFKDIPYVSQLLGFAFAGVFVVMGLVASLQVSAFGSKGIIKAGTWIKDKSVGAVKGVGKFAAQGGRAALDRTGSTDRTRNIIDSITDNKAINTVRDAVYGQGASNARRAAKNKGRVDDNLEKFADSANLDQLEKGAKQGTMAQRAVYQAKLAEKGEFSRVGGVDDQKAAMANMATYGKSLKEAITKDPRLAGNDPGAIRDLLLTTNSATGLRYTQAEAEKELRTRAYKKSKLDEVSGGIFKDDDALVDLLEQTSIKKLAKSRENLDAGREAALKALLPKIQAAEMAARTAGNIAKADQLEAVWLEIDSWI